MRVNNKVQKIKDTLVRQIADQVEGSVKGQIALIIWDISEFRDEVADQVLDRIWDQTFDIF